MKRDQVLLVLACSAIMFPSNVGALSVFDFGISMSMTVPANEEVRLMASITNRGTDPLDFGCTVMGGCTNYSARGVAAGPGEGLSALNFEFGGSALYSRVLAPGETFGFVFGTIRFDPLDPLGNPYGTALHPRFSVVFDQFQTHAETAGLTISIGALSFAPPTYFASHPTSDPAPAPVPEPSTLLLLASGLAGLGGMSWRRHRRG